jgi:hypothetical protein
MSKLALEVYRQKITKLREKRKWIKIVILMGRKEITSET